MRQLETLLGAQLINRTTRRVALTEIGRVYYQRCIDILEQVDDATRTVLHHQTHLTGRLRINAPMVFGTMELSQWLPEFMQSYPDLEIDLVCNDRFVDLISEEFDVGLRITHALPDSTLIAKRLTTSEMILVASPAYLQRCGVPQQPQDLVRHNYLSYSLALQSTELVFTGPDNTSHCISIRGNLQANTGIVICDAVRSGIGITASASFVVHEDIVRGDLVQILPAYRLTPRELFVLYPQNRHLSPKVRTFVNFVTDYYATPRWQC